MLEGLMVLFGFAVVGVFLYGLHMEHGPGRNGQDEL
jgi:hypothetical protein